MNKDDLKLVYVLKIGYNSKQEGLYEFLFSKDPSSIDTDSIGWKESPASSNANPPESNDVDLVLSLKTNKIDLKCLHELDDRAYIDGYYTIHCLAYEDLESDNSDVMYDETALLVFHYGLKAGEVKDLFLSRDILMKEVESVKPKPLTVKTEEDNDDEEDDDSINF